MSLAAAIVALSLQGPVVVVADRLDWPRSAGHVRVAESWDDLDQSQRDRALRNYQHYMDLPADKKKSNRPALRALEEDAPRRRDKARRKHDEYRGMGLVDD